MTSQSLQSAKTLLNNLLRYATADTVENKVDGLSSSGKKRTQRTVSIDEGAIRGESICSIKTDKIKIEGQAISTPQKHDERASLNVTNATKRVKLFASPGDSSSFSSNIPPAQSSNIKQRSHEGSPK